MLSVDVGVSKNDKSILKDQTINNIFIEHKRNRMKYILGWYFD